MAVQPPTGMDHCRCKCFILTGVAFRPAMVGAVTTRDLGHNNEPYPKTYDEKADADAAAVKDDEVAGLVEVAAAATATSATDVAVMVLAVAENRSTTLISLDSCSLLRLLPCIRVPAATFQTSPFRQITPVIFVAWLCFPNYVLILYSASRPLLPLVVVPVVPG